ncbi:MAG: B12-binding domain-containing radical SAM protein [Candidatus Omnitrophota bacterium]
MKILLLTPPQVNAFKHRRKNKHSVKYGFLPPLGIGYVAAVLEPAGHTVKIIDAPVFDYDYDDLVRETQDFSPDLIGISIMTPTAPYGSELAKHLKQKFPLVPIVMGGAHPTIFPEETIDMGSQVDIVVCGEGEYVMLDLVRCLEQGRPIDEVRGIYFKRDGRVINTGPAPEIQSLDKIPFPARHLYVMSQYAPEPFESQRLPSTNIIVSRGCTYARCTFCYRSGKLKRRYRTQSPQRSIEEIKTLVRDYKVRELVFYDDDLFSNKKWMREFLDLLEKEKLDIVWSIRGRSNTTDYELLKKARQLGCWNIEYGFESGNQDLLDNIRKGITLEQSRRVAKWANELGIDVVGTFMLALPGETPAKARQTIDFAIELDCAYAAFIPTHPFIGTALYEDCQKVGRLVDDLYAENMAGTRFLPKISYIPDGYKSAGEVARMCQYAYRKFYFRPRFIWKHLKKIKSMEDIRRYWQGLRLALGLVK